MTEARYYRYSSHDGWGQGSGDCYEAYQWWRVRDGPEGIILQTATGLPVILGGRCRCGHSISEHGVFSLDKRVLVCPGDYIVRDALLKSRGWRIVDQSLFRRYYHEVTKDAVDRERTYRINRLKNLLAEYGERSELSPEVRA